MWRLQAISHRPMWTDTGWTAAVAGSSGGRTVKLHGLFIVGDDNFS